MKIFAVLLASSAYASAALAAEPAATTTNSIGVEFVLIEPGQMVVGKYEAMYPTPSGLKQGAVDIGRGGGGGRGNAGNPAPTAPGNPAPTAAGNPAPAAAPPPAAPRRGGAAPLTPEQYQIAADRAAKEAMPGFTVKIAKAYYIGKFEVTQAQWKAVMGRNPSAFQAGRVDDDPDKHPVDSVTWDDAQAFVKKLNEMEKTKAYRLPTEFEWEYAARAGNPDDITTAEAADQGWFRGHNHRTTYAVGLKKPNAWGVYDMIGNVWEWVQDFDNLKFFADPTPPRTGKYHVLKGAGFTSHEKNATYMVHGGGPGTPFETGFRIVRDAN